MSKLINLLNKNKMTLIVSLPQNDLELAKTALDAGADALQLQAKSGTFENEKADLSKIAKTSKAPVGIVPGGKDHLSHSEMEEIVRMGFDFFNMDFEHLPSFMLQLKGISKVLSLNSRFTLDKLMGLSSLGADALDAAVIPADGLGKELVVGDLQNYIAIIISAGIPVIVPTQRSIKTSEVAIISDTGAKGLLLTPVVTGTTSQHIKKAVSEFRAAADDLA